MKANGFIITLAVGMLAALPAYAGSGLIKVTHATPVKGATLLAPATMAKPKIQVAVMATSPSQPARGRFVLSIGKSRCAALPGF
jgi:hypothetical protein